MLKNKKFICVMLIFLSFQYTLYCKDGKIQYWSSLYKGGIKQGYENQTFQTVKEKGKIYLAYNGYSYYRLNKSDVMKKSRIVYDYDEDYNFEFFLYIDDYSPRETRIFVKNEKDKLEVSVTVGAFRKDQKIKKKKNVIITPIEALAKYKKNGSKKGRAMVFDISVNWDENPIFYADYEIEIITDDFLQKLKNVKGIDKIAKYIVKLTFDDGMKYNFIYDSNYIMLYDYDPINIHKSNLIVKYDKEMNVKKE